jgi:DNA-directed RNA polymerase subunit RPC12/RpoP
MNYETLVSLGYEYESTRTTSFPIIKKCKQCGAEIFTVTNDGNKTQRCDECGTFALLYGEVPQNPKLGKFDNVSVVFRENDRFIFSK